MPTWCACCRARRRRSGWCPSGGRTGRGAIATAYERLTARAPLRHRRCGDRRASDGDRRGLRRPAAGHRRVGRGDGPAGEFPPRRPAADRGDAATLPRQRRHAAVRRVVLARDARADRPGARPVPVLELDPLATPTAAAAAEALAWAKGKLAAAARGDRRQRAARRSRGAAGEARARAPPARWSSRRCRDIAEGLVARGVRRLVVAGGETSGAVVQRLGVTSLRIGPEIDPGVPWTLQPRRSRPAPGAEVGQFRRRDFFLKACASDGAMRRKQRCAEAIVPLGEVAVRARPFRRQRPAISACGCPMAT